MPILKYDELQLRFDPEVFPGFDEVIDDAQERIITPEEARLISEAARQEFIQKANERMADPRAMLEEAPAGAEWFTEYLSLVEKGWPWRVACYIAWAASPKTARWPRTLQELATDVLGLTSPRTVYTWRRKHPSIDTTIAMMQAAPLWEHRRDVFEALVEMAKSVDYKAFNDRKLFLELLGDYVPKSKLELGKSSKSGVEELSDDELMKHADLGGSEVEESDDGAADPDD